MSERAPQTTKAEHLSGETRTTDGETRQQIINLLLERGELSAVEIGKALHLSPTGIRRHLDNLVREGTAEIATERQKAKQSSKRGRPAKRFQLTDAGRDNFGHHYDSLATQALHMLRETGGDRAIEALAQQRAAQILGGITPHICGETDEDDVETKAQELAEAFARYGYRSTVQRAGQGVQICQHHCPIAHVAAEFPEMCTAEQEAIAALFGQHVQPLATIADGQHICTTNIPLRGESSGNTKANPIVEAEESASWQQRGGRM